MTALTDGAFTSPAGDSLQPGEVVTRLRSTFANGATKSYEWRIQQLEGIIRLVGEHERDIAEALASDLGRNAHDSWFGDIAGIRSEATFALKHLKKWMRPRRVGLPLALRPGKASYRYEPLGVVLIIGPWNYPFYLCIAPMVGALAAGNCVVLKPSEHAPAASETMARLIPEYLDNKAITVVQGQAQRTQDLISARVDHVFFTGGTEIGREVMQAAAAHLTPVTLELGGKSPAIVAASANLDVAARRIVFGKIINSGQTCVAPDYVLVEEAVKDQFVDLLKSNLAALRTGEAPVQKIVNEHQFARLKRLLDLNPGSVVVGGDTELDSISVAPTIVLDADPDSALMSTEIFGPILPVMGIKSLKDAFAFVNSREKPLAMYIFSRNKADVKRAFDEVSAGGTTANHVGMHVLAPQLPFGGVGESGIGSYHGEWGFQRFSHRKSTLTMPSRPDFRMVYPPYSDRDRKLLRKLA